ncbi:MAG TPA: BBE domain-containing protein, partial [Candidatus Acidoferrales bacterium]|nr:BBE domain-containing protein [Candidatus Acidoferrales bacterium]
PLRAFGPPLADSIKAVPFLEAVTEEEPAPFPNCAKDGFFPPMSNDAIGAICAHLEKAPPLFQMGIFDMHGAACAGDHAFPLRRPALDAWTWGFWRSDAERDRTVAWVDALWAGIGKFTDRAYVNGLEADEGERRIRAAYGANYDRLSAIKRRYDPTNFFHMNQNIKPAA